MLMMLIAGLGIAVEFPHHDHQDAAVPSESGEGHCGCEHLPATNTVGADLPQHDHHDEHDSDACNGLCPCLHLQHVSVLAHPLMLPVNQANTDLVFFYSHSLLTPPSLRLDRPPKSHLS
jgi:hypothetical protein